MLEIFRREEKKYLVTKDQYKEIIEQSKDNVTKDKYFKETISSIYFDNDHNELTIKSLEKPIYKEKIRLRAYNTPNINDIVFLEIKKKYKGIVSKRRVALTLKEANEYIEKGIIPKCNQQIMKEIDYCFKKYKLKPKTYVSYQRTSYIGTNNEGFRLTFDKNVRTRNNDLELKIKKEDKIFLKDKYIMEVKCLDSMPIWFVKILSNLKIYPTSYSKIGEIYKGGNNV